jgi:hypothetical protein
MKKLLLLINLGCIIFVVSACQNTKQVEQAKAMDTKLVRSDSVVRSDSIKINDQTITAGTAGTDGGIKKDTNASHNSGHAIIHHGPNEAKIDSIKNAKAKDKK